MGWTTTARCTRWAAWALAGAMLTACGGGGGSGGDDGGSPPPGGGGPTGHLWHNNYALDTLDGTQVAALDGSAPALVTSHLVAVPWPDGSQYAIAEWDTAEDTTVVTVRNTSTGATLHELSFDGYVRNLRPSPTDKSMLMATWGEDSVSPAYAIFVDMEAVEIVDALSADEGPVQWLPDGRYIHVSNTGAVDAASVTGTPTRLGQVNLPAGKVLGAVSVNPQGTQMAMRLMVQGDSNILESDIWVAGIDGSALAQLTDTGASNYAKWSPDGRYIAFDLDTGLVCGGGTCVGSCGLWYAPASSRLVKALPSSNDAFKFRVNNRQQQEQSLGCELLAWLG